MRVNCHIEDRYVDGDHVPQLLGVGVICTRCQNEAEAIGQSEWSVRAALARLRETCPKKEKNFYADPNDDIEIDTRTHVSGRIEP